MRIYPPVYALAAMAVMAALDMWAPLVVILSPPWTAMGGLPISVGLGLMGWAAWVFRRHDTTIHPFQRASALVISGPFAFSRNPIYLGLTLVLLGVALALGSVTPFLVVPVFTMVIDRHIIGPEEQLLAETFGARFAQYRVRVRRWL